MTAGLEPAAAVDACRLGASSPEIGRGAVRVRGDLEMGARLTLGMRAAPRVVLELAAGMPEVAAGFIDRLTRIPWEEWLPPGTPWAVRASGVTPELRTPLHTARLVKDAVRHRFEARGRSLPPVDPRAPRVLVDFRLERTGASAGIDLGGHSLHSRGTGRRGDAPLREDVAAGLALLAGIDRDRPLLDPFCGTGTLVAEAASIALGIPPDRPVASLGLASLPPFRTLSLEAIADSLRPGRVPPHAPLIAADRDPRALEQARAVLDRHGLSRHVELLRSEVHVLEVPADGPGLVLTNPPWGLRLTEDAEAAWHGLGTLARRRLAGWTIAALSGNPQVTRHLGLRAERRYPLVVGGIDARLLLYRVHRRRAPAEPVD